MNRKQFWAANAKQWFSQLLSSKVFIGFIAGAMLASVTCPQAQTGQNGVANATGAGSTSVQMAPAKPKTKKIAIIIFPGFESLDVYGPVQMWGRLPDHELVMVSQYGGPVKSSQGIETVATDSFESAPQFDIIMIPGGMGTRTEVNNPVMLDFLRKQDRGTSFTTSVCTGSAVLAKAGIQRGRNATSNKMAFKFATSQDSSVKWQGHARWVIDGKYITSSGVSAGTDMALVVATCIHPVKDLQTENWDRNHPRI